MQIDMSGFSKGIPMECAACKSALPTKFTDGGMQLASYCPECGAKQELTTSGGADATKARKVVQISERDHRRGGSNAAEQSRAVVGKAALEVQKRAALLIAKAAGKLSEADAISQVFADDPALYASYRKSALSARGVRLDDDGPEAA